MAARFAVGAVVVDHSAGQALDALRGREERHRIEVALQRDPIGGPLPRHPQIGRPVESDGITADRGNRFQPLATALGEHD